jgi:spore coat polysaccharide biosynthesis protein SpsF
MTTIAVIQARLTSSRLPGKVMMPLPFPAGKPLIEYLYEKLSKASVLNQVVVAIPKGPEQEILRNFLRQQNMEMVEGSEEDVLSRFVLAAEKFQPKTIVRITADNPFIDLQMLEDALQKHLRSGVDYTVTEWLPYGMNIEIMDAISLRKLHVWKEINAHDREHVTPGFRRMEGMKMQTIRMHHEDLSGIRVTVDTREDYLRAAVLSALHENQPDSGDLNFIQTTHLKYPFVF